jgi:hypothetical protein
MGWRKNSLAGRMSKREVAGGGIRSRHAPRDELITRSVMATKKGLCSARAAGE